jgi:hypothetical protein
MAWRAALLADIARGRCVSSRGRFNPRGVKRKMSSFKVRRTPHSTCTDDGCRQPERRKRSLWGQPAKPNRPQSSIHAAFRTEYDRVLATSLSLSRADEALAPRQAMVTRVRVPSIRSIGAG